jgi:hypothetical protein
VRKQNHSKFGESDYKKATELANQYNNRYAAEVMGVHVRTIRKGQRCLKNILKKCSTLENYQIKINLN